MVVHFNTVPGWPQTRDGVLGMSDGRLTEFMGMCAAEPADFDRCLACFAFEVYQERRRARERVPTTIFDPLSHCPGWAATPEEVARYFHDEYERMAPSFGYKTQRTSAVEWDRIAENHRRLMMAVVTSVMLKWFPQHLAIAFGNRKVRLTVSELDTVTPPE